MHALAKDLGIKVVPGSVWCPDGGSERRDVTVQEAIDLAAEDNPARLNHFYKFTSIIVYFKTAPASAEEKRHGELNALLNGLECRPQDSAGMHSASNAQLTAGEELWIDYGHNGCHCGLTRDGNDGPLSFRAELDDSLDMVMRRLARIYAFKARSVRNLSSEATTLREIVQEDGELRHGVYRVSVSLQG
jgi:hypothetical protein